MNEHIVLYRAVDIVDKWFDRTHIAHKFLLCSDTTGNQQRLKGGIIQTIYSFVINQLFMICHLF